jgi:hypothetical protein
MIDLNTLNTLLGNSMAPPQPPLQQHQQLQQQPHHQPITTTVTGLDKQEPSRTDRRDEVRKEEPRGNRHFF